MESEVISLLLHMAREGGAAAGGALLVLSIVSWMGATGRIISRSMYLDMRTQRERYRRELREERRAHRNTIESYRKSVLPRGEE